MGFGCRSCVKPRRAAYARIAACRASKTPPPAAAPASSSGPTTWRSRSRRTAARAMRAGRTSCISARTCGCCAPACAIPSKARNGPGSPRAWPNGCWRRARSRRCSPSPRTPMTAGSPCPSSSRGPKAWRRAAACAWASRRHSRCWSRRGRRGTRASRSSASPARCTPCARWRRPLASSASSSSARRARTTPPPSASGSSCGCWRSGRSA